MSRPRRLAGFRLLAAWPASAFAVFSVIWAILDPLGGLDALEESISSRAIIYACTVLLSLVITLPVLLWSQARADEVESRRVGVSRIDVNFAKLMGSAAQRVRILGLTLPTFATEQSLRTIDNLVTRGVRVEVVLVNPLSPSLGERPSSLYTGQPNPRITGATTLRTLVNHRNCLGPSHRGLLSVRLTRQLPTLGAVVVDGVCIWHPYVTFATGVSSPYIEEPVGVGFGPVVVRYFEDLQSPENSIEATLDVGVLEDHASTGRSDRDRIPSPEEEQAKAILRLDGEVATS